MPQAPEDTPDGATDRLVNIKHDLTAAEVSPEWGIVNYGKDLAVTLVLWTRLIDDQGVAALLGLAIHAKNSGHELAIICHHRAVYEKLRAAELCCMATVLHVGSGLY